MKKVLLFAAALMILSSAASAQLDGWLDIFADSLDSGGHIQKESCLYPAAMRYVPVDVYIIARPPADGLMAIAFRIVMPEPCAMLVQEDLHPDVNLTMGDYYMGMRLSFATCQTAPALLVCHLMWLTIDCPWSTDCQTIVLVPYGGLLCAEGYPPFVAAHCCDVYLNCIDYPCNPIATKEESWGAIKSMYK